MGNILATSRQVNWTGVAVTASTISATVLAVLTIIGRVIMKTMRQQANEVIKPAMDSIQTAMTDGFHELTSALSDTNQRVSRLEGKVGVTIMTPSATIQPMQAEHHEHQEH